LSNRRNRPAFAVCTTWRDGRRSHRQGCAEQAKQLHACAAPTLADAQRQQDAVLLDHRWQPHPIYGYDRFADEDHFSAYAANIYRKDYWLESPVRVEVWVEKDAMAGKLKPVVRDEYGLDLYVSRGFASETYLQEAGAQIRSDGHPTYVYLLTDFDASGMGIAETVEDKLLEMAYPVDVFVERIAATPNQISEYGLITQPVTRSDTRACNFIQRFGTETVELDTIPASEIRRLVRDAIERHMDPRRLAFLRMVEQEEREGIRALLGGAA
jgi:hypothetical protein